MDTSFIDYLFLPSCMEELVIAILGIIYGSV
jgi:hypothetical protein